MKETLKVFISYSHNDEKHINEFIKHNAPLRNNGLIEEWYDRKIVAGEDFQDTIDNNLELADIICLFISADFLNSTACMKEKERAFELKKKNGIRVVAIILSPCGWLDVPELSKSLALPIDGKPITSFSDNNSAWYQVYCELKKVIKKVYDIKNLETSEDFNIFLNSTDIFTKAHSQKKEVLINDIFIYPELEKYDDLREFEKKCSSELILSEFIHSNKIVIAGEDQSGKTTLCKKLFLDLRSLNYVPIYISDKQSHLQGNILIRLEKSFKEQYNDSKIEFCEIDNDRIIPIIDDFHLAKKKEKHIIDLDLYKKQVLIVDDIFSLNVRDENLIKSYIQFKIKQLSPSLRHSLIEKWVHLNDNDGSNSMCDNDLYKEIDTKTEFVNTALGKVLSSGIMPSYPFFILSIISTYETFEKPLDQEITSQGYCYQALIYLFLRKQGVKNDEFDTYINFLTEFAYYLFKTNKLVVSQTEFNEFHKEYLDKYNFPIKKDTLFKNLQNTRILNIDSFNNYSFQYNYLYYFFVAKYLAEKQSENKETINSIINNLHINANAYIAIFISHHSKSIYVLDEIILNALCLFDKFEPATLTKEELSFFDEKIDVIVKAVLPERTSTPERYRTEILKKQDIIEEIREAEEQKVNLIEDNEDEFAKELRRSIKTVEVMGRIIKNRAGSLEKSKLENIFEEAMNVHLRILTSFFELIKSEDQQLDLISFIRKRLEIVLKEKPNNLSYEELEKMSTRIFWNTNFSVVYGFLKKIIHSLGSDKLQPIIESVCSKNDTPATFLVKHGILMWYNKSLQPELIAKRIESDGFSETAKRVTRFMIVNHCHFHKLSFKDYQRIEQEFNIPRGRLMQGNKDESN